MSNSTFETIGKYVLLEKLATGGMAEVFLARALGTGGISKFFAIKRILPQYADSPEFVDMFREEAKIAINLKHSNIASIHEFGIQEKQFFLVMDFVEGRNLRQILNKMKKMNVQFSTEHVTYIIREIAAGLDHAHRCIDGTTGKPLNITHRDMSPQNVMVSFDGEVKIVDFGIAKAESQVETTRAGTLKGKFGYMSPEQAEGLPVDMRTDIFSLGIVLWELLANDRLFAANNEINTLRKIRDCHIPSLRKINPNIHSELERIVYKALAKDKNLRYQSAAALHRDLNRFLNRQYPDYSAHDFSAFIKSIFTDEILALRKSLVEYSKSSNTNAPKSKSYDERTLLTASESLDNSSLIYSQTESDIRAAHQEKSEAKSLSNADIDKTMVQPMTPSNPPESQATVVRPNGDTPPHPDMVTNLTDSINTNSGILSTSILRKASQSEVKLNITPETVSSLPSSSTTSFNKVDLSARATNSGITYKKSKPAMSVSSPLIYMIIGGLGFMYLVKFHPGPMAKVIQATRPILGSVYTAIGVDGQLNKSSQIPTPQATNVALPKEDFQPESLQETTSQRSAIVTSNPSGAEIYMNGKKTGLLTPSRVQLPDHIFAITLKRQGYEVFILPHLDPQKVDGKIQAQLVKGKLAYVDLEVFPMQDVSVEINGSPLDVQSFPVLKHPIPANETVRIKVKSRSGDASEYEVRLVENQKKTLTFRLNPATRRMPSNKK